MPSAVVLIVEDDPLIRLAVAMMIEDAGLVVIEATNADDAITILESRTDIKVVFTDINMPGSLDGLKLAFAVRDRWPPVTIIVTSGRIKPRSGDLPEGVMFIQKPYSEALLLEAVLRAA